MTLKLQRSLSRHGDCLSKIIWTTMNTKRFSGVAQKIQTKNLTCLKPIAKFKLTYQKSTHTRTWKLTILCNWKTKYIAISSFKLNKVDSEFMSAKIRTFSNHSTSSTQPQATRRPVTWILWAVRSTRKIQKLKLIKRISNQSSRDNLKRQSLFCSTYQAQWDQSSSTNLIFQEWVP